MDFISVPLAGKCVAVSYLYHLCTKCSNLIFFAGLSAFSSPWLFVDPQVSLHNYAIYPLSSWYHKLYFCLLQILHSGVPLSILSSTFNLSAINRLLYFPLSFDTVFLTPPVEGIGPLLEDIMKHGIPTLTDECHLCQPLGERKLRAAWLVSEVVCYNLEKIWG